MKKAIVWVGSIVILGAGLVFSADNPQVQSQKSVQERVQSNFQQQILFVDENGDGICDFMVDHDGDGIPNGQDPDWNKPQDGTGNKYMKGNKAGNRNGNQSGNPLGNKNNFRGGNNWGGQSPRQNKANFGGGVCDGTGPQGSGNKGGRN